MTLSLALHIPLSEVRKISTQDLIKYHAYYQLSPFGLERFDILFALLTTVVANGYGAKATLSDFMPRWGEKPLSADDKISRWLKAQKKSK